MYVNVVLQNTKEPNVHPKVYMPVCKNIKNLSVHAFDTITMILITCILCVKFSPWLSPTGQSYIKICETTFDWSLINEGSDSFVNRQDHKKLQK